MPTVPRDSFLINANHGRPQTSATATDPLRLPAVHYAAHAVTAGIQNVDWGDVIISNDRGHFRAGGSDELLCSSRIADVRRGAAVRLAGGIAEFVATENEMFGARLIIAEISDWPDCDWTTIDRNTIDRNTTYSNVARVAGNDFLPAMCCLVQDSFAIVHAHWLAIERIASELIKHGRVSAHQVRKAIVEAWIDRDDNIANGAWCDALSNVEPKRSH